MAANKQRKRRANGTGTSPVFHEGRKRWLIRVTVDLKDGKPVRREVSGKTLAEVEAKASELKRQRSVGVTGDGAKITVAQWIDEWLSHRTNELAPGTITNYRDVAKSWVVPHLGRERLDKVTPRQVRAMLTALDRQGMSTNTQRLARIVLGAAMRQAAEDGLIISNPVQKTRGPRIVKVHEKRTLSVDQAQQLLDHLRGRRIEPAIFIALTLGVRRGELLGLCWPDVHLDGPKPYVDIRQQLQRQPDVGLVLRSALKRDKSVRQLRLTADAAAKLKQLRKDQARMRQDAGTDWDPLPGMSHLVFTSPQGRPIDPDWFGKLFGRATVDAGLGKWTPHELRHSFASLALGHGDTPEKVADFLGNTQRTVVETYRHQLGHENIDTAERVGNVLRLPVAT